jgi:ABC-type transport system substrate-binding protein
MDRILRRLGPTSLLGLLLVAVTGAPMGAQDADDQGGTLSIAFSSDLASLDPAIAYDSVSVPAARLIFETLVTYDEGTGLVPQLAAEMPSIAEDGRVYTIELRDGIQFVQAGQALRETTADDVVHSLNRLLRPDLLPYPSPVGSSFFSAIEGSEAVLDGSADTATGLVAVDSDTVRITLSRPDRTFLNSLALPNASIVPAELAGLDSAAFSSSPVGTGPYWLESWTPGERLVFQRNQAYWRDRFPKADTIDFRLLVTAESQLLQAQANELDIMGDAIPPAAYEALVGDPLYAERLVSGYLVAHMFLAMDTSGPESPFADARVRQAVNHAIDKANIVRIWGGRAQELGCLFPGGLPGFDPACGPYDYSPERARELLEEAGVDPFSTTLYTDPSELSVSAAESIAADLAGIGIDVEVVTQDFATLLGTIKQPHAAPLAYTGWAMDFPDPAIFVDGLFGCAAAVAGGTNASWYCDEEVDALIAEARATADLEAAIPRYQVLQERIMADAPIAPIFVPEWTVLRSERVPAFDELHPVWFQDLATYPIVE